MESDDEMKGKSSGLNLGKTRSIESIKSDYFLEKVYSRIPKNKCLGIVRFSKKMQKRLGLTIKDYKEYSETLTPIWIELTPVTGKYGQFINIENDEEKQYYHIYFNDSQEEVKKYEIKEEDKVKIIKIVIDPPIKSFKSLFLWCECIKACSFKKFNRTNIDNMSNLFFKCSSLKDFNYSRFNTENVTDMEYMFYRCDSLETLDIQSFDTRNVENMSYMFCDCLLLKEIDLSKWDILKVTNLSNMFNGCDSITSLTLNDNWKTNEVTYMNYMFADCRNLEILKGLSGWNTEKVLLMNNMFQN
jgi:surface protein